MRPPLSFPRLAATALASLVVAAGAAPTAAQANIGDSANIVQPFTVTVSKSAPNSGRCAVVSLTGNLRYKITDKVSTDLMGPIPYRQYDGFTVAPTNFVLRTRNGCAATGTKYVNSSGANARLSIWNTVCHYNLSPSIGFPLGVGAALTPECGDERVATWLYNHSAATSNYSLSLAPGTVRYATMTRPLQPNGPAPCVRIQQSEGTIYVGARGYPYDSSTWKVCANH